MPCDVTDASWIDDANPLFPHVSLFPFWVIFEDVLRMFTKLLATSPFNIICTMTVYNSHYYLDLNLFVKKVSD